MTDDELKELFAGLAIAQKETDRQLRELGKQIGGLGEKFGGFTEGLALPSMTKILTEHFGMEVVTPGSRSENREAPRTRRPRLRELRAKRGLCRRGQKSTCDRRASNSCVKS